MPKSNRILLMCHGKLDNITENHPYRVPLPGMFEVDTLNIRERGMPTYLGDISQSGLSRVVHRKKYDYVIAMFCEYDAFLGPHFWENMDDVLKKNGFLVLIDHNKTTSIHKKAPSNFRVLNRLETIGLFYSSPVLNIKALEWASYKVFCKDL